jgi:hypothetical protein
MALAATIVVGVFSCAAVLLAVHYARGAVRRPASFDHPAEYKLWKQEYVEGSTERIVKLLGLFFGTQIVLLTLIVVGYVATR